MQWPCPRKKGGNMVNPASVLQGLARISAIDADSVSTSEFLLSTTFFPVHYGVIQPPLVRFIVGARGMGKTHLFRAMNIPECARWLYPDMSGVTWIVGYSRRPFPISLDSQKMSPRFPNRDTLREFHRRRGAINWSVFWLGLLLGAVIAQEDKICCSCGFSVKNWVEGNVAEALSDLAEVERWYDVVGRSTGQITAALNRLCEQMERSNQYLVVGYDALDSLSGGWGDSPSPIRVLSLLWTHDWGRWQRIRPKIFVRNETFITDCVCPDRRHFYEIVWPTQDLYEAVFKLLANQGPECREFLTHCELGVDYDPLLGWYISDGQASGIARALYYLMGAYIRRSPETLPHDILDHISKWIVNCLSDAQGRVGPGTMIRLFSEMAQAQLAQDKECKTLFLAPYVVGAIETALRQQAEEVMAEYPWMKCVKEAFRGCEFPVRIEDAIRLLEEKFREWDCQPPGSGKEMVYLLQSMGVVRISPYEEGRKLVFLSDAYQYGFGILNPRTDLGWIVANREQRRS